MSSPVPLIILSLNVSKRKGTPKTPVARIRVDPKGVRGDAHYNQGFREVSILGGDSLRKFTRKTGHTVKPGDFAENITVSGLEVSRLRLGDRLVCGRVILEVNQIGKACHGNDCAIFQRTGTCAMPREGLFCRPLRGGVLSRGDSLTHEPRRVKACVVTLSDRASRGVYSDRSGPVVEAALKNYFQGKAWELSVERELIPDAPARLRRLLGRLYRSQFDLVVLTGGTGIGPRDTTPDIVSAFCERLIPGVMDEIRLRSARSNPHALLSRSVCGVKGRMMLYSLPGSVRAAEEYMRGISRTMEHALLMVRGLDAHG